MKRLKRSAAVLLLVCLCISSISMNVHAADGTIAFTDLETAVGENFTIRCKVSSAGDRIGEVSLQMSYDPNYIQFMSGDDGVTQESAGQLVYQGTGDGDMLQFEMEFQALQEGQMRMSLDNTDVQSEYGTSLDFTLGYSDVTIAEGDPSKIISMKTGPEVEFGGEQYNLSESFSEADIPSGFTAGSISYEGESFAGAIQNNGDMELAYLVDLSDVGKFYVYDESTGEFSGFEQVIISDTSFIILLQEDESLSISSQYQKKKLTLNGHEFPAWQDTKNTDYYLVYALNQEGSKLIYRYDSVEGTYQRFIEEDPGTGELTAGEGSRGLFGGISDYMKEHIDQFLIGAGMLLILAIVFATILGVKLHNRNVELDEMYEELEACEDYENEQAAEPLTAVFDDEEGLDEYDEEGYDEYDEEEDLTSIKFNDLLSNKGEAAVRAEDSDGFDDYEDLDLGQTDDLLLDPADDEAESKPKRRKDDTFELDIIDL